MAKGGKRKGAGRPNNNSVRKNITLPAHYIEFVKNNKLSLSKLAQQKIKEIMNTKKVKKLIEEYNVKIKHKDISINKCKELLTKARKGTISIDVEDVRIEKQNAQTERQIYFQFTKDLEDLI